MVDVARNVAASLQAVTPQGTATAAKVVSKQQLQIKPSSQAERFIANVTSSTKLSPSAKQGLIELTARVDKQLNASAKNHAFIDIAGLSVLLEESASEGFPKYILMTGLRFYAAVGETFPPEPANQELVKQEIAVQTDNFAQRELGQSLEQVRAAVQQNAELQKAAIQKVGQTVDVDGFADSDTGSGAPTTVTFA